MQKAVITILFLGMWIFTNAQNTLTGFAPDFVGEKVTLYTFQDYITRSKIVLGEGVVSKVDSTFSITYSTNTTIKGQIEIKHTEASLYLTPNADYSIFFPKSLEIAGNQSAKSNMYFMQLDTADINYRILQYHEWFDIFIEYHKNEVARGGFLAYLDTFKIYTVNAYKHINDPFFITYVRYDIAEMGQTFGANRRSEQRLETFLDYIEPFPVYYENDRYMKFLTAFYDKEFREYLPITEKAIMTAIHYQSPTMLMQALKGDIFLANPTLRELMMVDKLGKAYYNEIEYRPNILTILDSVANHAISEVNATVAKNVKKYLTNLEPGYPAPVIHFANTNGDIINWSSYTGKFVYLNFFATWSDQAVKDMAIIAKLVAKFDEDIAFVSVCTDTDSAAYKTYLMDHPDYYWDIFYAGNDEDFLHSFNINTVPNYFLIDQDGFIFAAPALAPSPNGNLEYVEQTLFKIKKALHPTKVIRVGEK